MRLQVSGGVRLQKVLAAAGVASRRAAEDLIREGRVTVNGKPAVLGIRVNPSLDRIEVDGSRIPVDEAKRYVMLNKPAGVISTVRDPEGRPTVAELVPSKEKLHPAGRLDAETEGLLLLTNDGELTYRLTHPSFAVPKIYVAEVQGSVDRSVVRRLVEEGVKIDSGRPAKAMRARILDVRAGRKPRSVLEVTVHEGRKHVVRRMLEESGHAVDRLIRMALGPLRLKGLAPGEYRELTASEVASLYKAAGL